jgi:hypothetical protein
VWWLGEETTGLRLSACVQTRVEMTNFFGLIWANSAGTRRLHINGLKRPDI